MPATNIVEMLPGLELLPDGVVLVSTVVNPEEGTADDIASLERFSEEYAATGNGVLTVEFDLLDLLTGTLEDDRIDVGFANVYCVDQKKKNLYLTIRKNLLEVVKKIDNVSFVTVEEEQTEIHMVG